MKNRFLKFSVKIQSLMMSEEGQDLIEYALVVALIAFAAVGSMQSLSADINNAFAGIGTELAGYVP